MGWEIDANCERTRRNLFLTKVDQLNADDADGAWNYKLTQDPKVAVEKYGFDNLAIVCIHASMMYADSAHNRLCLQIQIR
jgi:hypothetical protein